MASGTFEKTYTGMPDTPTGFTVRISARYPRRRMKALAWCVGWLARINPKAAARVGNAGISRCYWEWRIDDGRWRREQIPFSLTVNA